MIDSFVSLKCSIPVDVICPDVISTNCAYDRSSSPMICHDASVSIVTVNPFAIVTGPAVNPLVNSTPVSYTHLTLPTICSV